MFVLISRSGKVHPQLFSDSETAYSALAAKKVVLDASRIMSGRDEQWTLEEIIPLEGKQKFVAVLNAPVTLNAWTNEYECAVDLARGVVVVANEATIPESVYDLARGRGKVFGYTKAELETKGAELAHKMNLEAGHIPRL
jgi:hypothetical protein